MFWGQNRALQLCKDKMTWRSLTIIFNPFKHVTVGQYITILAKYNLDTMTYCFFYSDFLNVFSSSDRHQAGQTAGAPNLRGRLLLLVIPDDQKKNKTSFAQHACLRCFPSVSLQLHMENPAYPSEQAICEFGPESRQKLICLLLTHFTKRAKKKDLCCGYSFCW